MIKLDNCVISSDGTTLIDIDDDVTELILPYNINRIYKVQCVQKKIENIRLSKCDRNKLWCF